MLTYANVCSRMLTHAHVWQVTEHAASMPPSPRQPNNTNNTEPVARTAALKDRCAVGIKGADALGPKGGDALSIKDTDAWGVTCAEDLGISNDIKGQFSPLTLGIKGGGALRGSGAALLAAFLTALLTALLNTSRRATCQCACQAPPLRCSQSGLRQPH